MFGNRDWNGNGIIDVFDVLTDMEIMGVDTSLDDDDYDEEDDWDDEDDYDDDDDWDEDDDDWDEDDDWDDDEDELY